MLDSSDSYRSPFGARSTADQVLAGIDLTNRHFLVTGCDSGIGLATMHALAANGAAVIGLARTAAKAADACGAAGPNCKPIGCDLSDLSSVRAAADAVLRLEVPLDGIVANAGVAGLPDPRTRYGVDEQFLVNYLAQALLVNLTVERVRERSGRIVVIGDARHTPREGMRFDNLDGSAAYDPTEFYGRSKFALALYAKELSRRLGGRGIAVNIAEPGRTAQTGIGRHRAVFGRLNLPFARLWSKSPEQGAATQTLLIASPRVAGITGACWRDCGIVAGHPLLQDATMAEHLWSITEAIIANAGASNSRSFKVAA